MMKTIQHLCKPNDVMHFEQYDYVPVNSQINPVARSTDECLVLGFTSFSSIYNNNNNNNNNFISRG